MLRAFNIGRFFGIQFRIHPTWFIIFILVTVTLVSPYYSRWLYWIIGVVTSLLFFASVLAHELAHSLVGKANGVPISNITLFIFGGIAQMAREATRPSAELKMAIAGPACSLIIGVCFGLIFLLFEQHIPEPVATMILWLALMNGVLAVFNLIPGFPLDGGRVFRSLLWRFSGDYSRSTRIAARVGQGVGYLFILFGIVVIFLQPFDMSRFDGVWFAFIGLFLERVASASYGQVRRQQAIDGSTDSGEKTSDSPVVPSDTDVS